MVELKMGVKKMLFEQEKYYKYIKNLERRITIQYIAIIVIMGIIGTLTLTFQGFLIFGLLGFVIANIYTITTKIKIQEMKIKFDLYENLILKKQKEIF